MVTQLYLTTLATLFLFCAVLVYTVYKCMMRCPPEYLTSTCKLIRGSTVSTRNTKNSQVLNLSLFCTASDQRTFQYRATSLWNELQPALKLSPSVTAFKRLLRQKLLNDCFIQFFNFYLFIIVTENCGSNQTGSGKTRDCGIDTSTQCDLKLRTNRTVPKCKPVTINGMVRRVI